MGDKLKFKINPLKLKMQEKCVHEFKQNGFKATFELPPGIGKSYLAVLIIRDLLQKLPDSSICIVVPLLRLKYQWELDYIDSLSEEFPDATIEVMVINTAINTASRISYKLVIFDEIHEYLEGEHYGTVFDKRYAPNRVGLSGSLDQKKRAILQALNMPVVYSKSRKEALQEGLLTPTYIYHLRLPLSVMETKRLMDIRSAISKDISKLPDFYTKFLNPRNQCVLEYSDLVGWSPRQIVGIAMKIQRLEQERSKFYDSHPAKLQVYRDVISHFNEQQIITFSNSTSTVDTLTSINPEEAVSYHSNIKGEIFDEFGNLIGFKELQKKRRKINGRFKTRETSIYKVGEQELSKKELRVQYPKFKLLTEKKVLERNYLQLIQGEKRVINSRSALEVGIDISGLDVAAEFSRSSSPLSFIQRAGRLRASGGIYIRAFMILSNGKISSDHKKVLQSQGNEPFTEIETVHQIHL